MLVKISFVVVGAARLVHKPHPPSLLRDLSVGGRDPNKQEYFVDLGGTARGEAGDKLPLYGTHLVSGNDVYEVCVKILQVWC